MTFLGGDLVGWATFVAFCSALIASTEIDNDHSPYILFFASMLCFLFLLVAGIAVWFNATCTVCG